MARIWGFDIGTTSIGFAAIDFDKASGSGRILRLGVRIFPEARDAEGTPLNQQRRSKRMMRRQLRRRRARRRSLNALLTEAGLLPAFGGKDWDLCMREDPYPLRARAIKGEPLSAHELGRALYHLAKRRHFRERDLAEAEDGPAQSGAEVEEPATKPRGRSGPKKREPAPAKANDDAKAASARANFVAEVEAAGSTIGAMLAGRGKAVKRRGEHATRALVEEEFDRILADQAPHHPVLASPALQGALREAIFAQRPVFWRTKTLGTCSLMPGRPLCPRGSWLSQERRMLEKINNLEFVGGNARPLLDGERAALINALRLKDKLTWKQARDVLEPLFAARGESTKQLRFNHESAQGGGTGLRGNLVDVALAKVLGPAIFGSSHLQALRNVLPHKLWQADYGEIGPAGQVQRVVIRPQSERMARRAKLAERLARDFDIAPEAARALSGVHFPQGWEPYSTDALRIMLPLLEAGDRFGALIAGPSHAIWRETEFPDRSKPTGEILDKLPSPRADRRASPAQREEAERIARIRNPTVVRVQNELRKVVNNLIGLYGKPDLVRIELARDVGKSQREREEMSRGIRERERLRETGRKDLVSKGIANPSDEDLEKWLLWQECAEECPYTGANIGFIDLFGGNPRFEVEHIWPRSLSLDNSLRNKTLCEKSVNKEKGNRIPYHYFQSRQEEWERAKERVWDLVGRGRWSAGKARRFCADSIPDDFSARQLNDTSYAAREAIAFLKRLWPDVEIKDSRVTVQAVTGKVTAQLRRRWGLNDILGLGGEKTREDHRHHAIDALVVACTEPGSTQKLSGYFVREWEFRHGLSARPDPALVPAPWTTIRDDAAQAVRAIVVSHRVRRKVSGSLHKETTYGDTGQDITNSNGTYRLFVARKPLAALSKGEIADIRDGGVRRIVEEWVDTHGGDPKKAFATHPPRGPDGPLIKKARLQAPQKLRAMALLINGYATTGNNHHIAFYRLADGRIEGQVVSLFEAARRLARREPVVGRREEGRQFLMSLALGDTFQMPAGERAGLWVVSSISGNGQVFSRRINDAGKDPKALWGPSPAPLIKLGVTKVSVDPIGRVRPAND